MLVNCYLRQGFVYVPAVGEVERGFYRDIDPVAVVPVSDAAALAAAFRETITRGNIRVPQCTRENYPKPIMPKYAGVKSWAAFERGMAMWSIVENDGAYKIEGYRKRHDRGLEPDPDQIVTFAPRASVDEVAERMAAIVQAKASV